MTNPTERPEERGLTAHDHSKNGTWVLIFDGSRTVIYPDGCFEENR